MNKRAIIIGIVTIAITVCALVVGKTTRFSPVTAVQGHGSPIPIIDSHQSSTSAFVNQQKELTVENTKQTAAQVPDYVLYGQLFRSVMLLKQKAAEEEKQGKLAAGYTRVLQATLKLNDTANKELDDAATSWDKEREALTTKAETVIARYRGAEQNADDGARALPADASTELQQLNDKLNGATLAGRDELRQQLGEKEFEEFQKSVQENIAAQIKSMPVDEKNTSLPVSKERIIHPDRVPELPSDLRPGELRTVPATRPETTKPPANESPAGGGAKNAKRIALGNS